MKKRQTIERQLAHLVGSNEGFIDFLGYVRSRDFESQIRTDSQPLRLSCPIARWAQQHAGDGWFAFSDWEGICVRPLPMAHSNLDVDAFQLRHSRWTEAAMHIHDRDEGGIAKPITQTWREYLTDLMRRSPAAAQRTPAGAAQHGESYEAR